MSKTLEQIAETLSTPQRVIKKITQRTEVSFAVPKVQLIYAFNGTGKTRLCAELKDLIAAPNSESADDEDQTSFSQNKFLYYSAFTEDLFYWEKDTLEPKLNIQPNLFTTLILEDQGLDREIVDSFKRYSGSKIEPVFNTKENSIIFKKPEIDQILDSNGTPLEDDDGEPVTNSVEKNIKISKGEESNFIWSIFRTFLDSVISDLSEEDQSNRSIPNVGDLEYVFIDDPVSSLDDNHLIELAVELAMLIKKSRYENNQGLRFIITTHNSLFYNVLWNEFNNDLYAEKPDGSRGKRIYKRDQSKKYRLDKKVDDTFEFITCNDHPFSYHLFLLSELREAIRTDQIKKYHFNFLRNILEKTATFLGHNRWEELLEKIDGNPDPFTSRILNLSSHSAHAGEEIADIRGEDKEKLNELVTLLTDKYRFYKPKEDENARTN